jgi:hypothetical protein
MELRAWAVSAERQISINPWSHSLRKTPMKHKNDFCPVSSMRALTGRDARSIVLGHRSDLSAAFLREESGFGTLEFSRRQARLFRQRHGL